MNDKVVTRVRRSGVAEGMEVVGVSKARFLTLCKTPANQRSFSVLRSEDDNVNTKSRVSRTRRSDNTAVQQLLFPHGYTEETVAAALTQYGMDTYTVEAAEDGTFTARRSDLQSIAMEEVNQIKLTDDGVVAFVARAEGETATAGKTALAVSDLTFDDSRFTRSDVVSWLEKNEVDFTAEAIDNSSGKFVLQRMDAGAEETRSLELEEGIVATIVRNDVMNIPDGFVAVINEAAYSGWGWGQLDFNARLSDVAVGEKMREGLYQLDDLLRDIIFYSPLPIEMRKELNTRALTQFGAYINNLLDQLPRQLLMSVSSNTQRNDKAKEPDMSKDPGTTETTKDTEVVSMTRGDLKQLIAEAVRDAAKPAEATTEAKPADTEPATSALTRADLEAVVKEQLAPLQETVAKLQGTTVVRSDEQTEEAEKPQPELTDAQRSDSLFKGVITGRK